MNFTFYFFNRNPLKIFCFSWVLMFAGITLKAQVRENPALLRKQISSSKNNAQKTALLLRLSDYYISKKGELKSDLDSAEILNKEANLLIVKTGDKLNKGKSIFLEAKIDKERKNKMAAFSKMKAAVNYFEKNKMIKEAGEGYEELSFMYDNDPKNLDTKIKLKEKALSLFKNSGAKLQQGSVLKDLGELYNLMEAPDKSIPLLKESLVTYQSVRFKELQGVYNLLSQAEVQKANYEEALRYGLLAEKTAMSLNDNSLQMSSIYNHIGLVYYYLRQNDDAMKYWKKSLAVAKKNKDNGYIRTVANNISTMLIRQKKFDQAITMIKEYKVRYPIADQEFEMTENYILFSTYTILKQFKNAEIYYKKLVAHYGEDADKNNKQMSLLRGFIFYHYQTKNYDKMYREAKLFDSIAQNNGNEMLRSENYLIWFKADSTQGRYLDAIRHYQLYKKFSDSVFNGEKSKQISSLKIQFETDQKDKNIELLTQKGKLQDTQIANDTFIKYVFVGSIVVLILFAALLYNRSRVKSQANKKLELKRQQIDEQNEMLKKLLSEKEWLLKEIHHRVKNNLQIVISLLNTQSAYLDNEDALMAIQNSQHRMHAMSLIHQKLYQSDNLSTIDISWYIYELIGYIRECYSAEKVINFSIDTEKVFLDVSQAVPLGLIVNEAVNNTVKYAFPDNEKGEVLVSFKNTGRDFYELIISDNGVGLPENFDIDETESLGMNLMRGLAEQLDGTFLLENSKGLKIIITFRKNIEIDASK
ncbi:tetratricopeptide repeat-containing sensor histidine kinase [Chryseobacterium tongliaoense]|uniref:tetratricopeptide repeat-containing sensor histidine kinase n=1 Tax=Chryseobacterium tongliaoense TaxID=3240933 RepID=UPI003517F277